MGALEMTELDRLPPDQRAVLSLVLDRGKSYGEVAELLGIPEQTVRDRAHAALDAMASGPATGGGAPPTEDAPPTGDAPPTALQASSPPPSSSSADAPRRAPSSGGASALPSTPGPRQPRTPTPGPLRGSSRTGGALLLGGIVAIVVVAAILISSGGGGKSSSGAPTATGSTKSTTTTSAGKPSLNKTITLTPLDPTLKASGTAYVLSQAGRRAFYVAARGLPPSSGFFYAVWLYNSPSSSAPLGRAPAVGSDGRMEGGGPLPTNARIYRQLIITRETSTHPHQPGQIELRGTFGLR
jgi:hypothetical protein